MDDKQKPLRTAANKVKDIYNTYLRTDERSESAVTEETVPATTTNDINEVHAHHEIPAEPQLSVPLPTVDIVQTDYPSGEIESLRLNLQKMEKDQQDLREQLLRKVAEFENYKKRTEREKDQLLLYATERMFARLVEVLDDLHAALEAGRRSQDYASMLNGLELIYSKAHRIYEEHGVRPIIAEEGTPFNVDVHEALMHLPHSEIPEGQVIQQIQRGYTLHNKVLRHVKVVTSAGEGDSKITQ